MNHPHSYLVSVSSCITATLSSRRFVSGLIATALILLASPVVAQDFSQFFTPNTLRVDYTFSGNADRQDIYVDELCQLPGWYGKRNHLAELPIEGNGNITVRSHATQEVIYRNSFSTLFQEWLSYDEALTTKKSFENVFLVPMPRDTVDITVSLMNNRHEVMAQTTHMVVPTDILIHKKGYRNVTPYEVLQQPADTARCIHIAYVAEGYQESEMQTFLDDCQTAMEALFAHEPFKSLRDRFEIIAVKSPSIDSGTSEPAKGIWRQTALSSHFDTFYSDRYLTTLHLKQLHDWLAGTPYEHIIVLVNTAEYGGGGIFNSYNLSMTHHPKFRPVVVHEFGHSFAGLADEYAYEQEQIPMYPADIEPWEPNITTLVDFDSKWKDMVKPGTPIPTPTPAARKAQKPRRKDNNNNEYAREVGAFEGAGYSLKGVYRPMQDCRMRTNENPEFCPVCRRSIESLIRFYTE